MPQPVLYGHGWNPEIIGEIVRLHAIYYAREWGLGARFEATVAAELGAFIDSYDASVSRLFSASVDDRLVGSLTIAGTRDPEGAARLRWFILADEARGRGIGKRLMQMAMDFFGRDALQRLLSHDICRIGCGADAL